MMSNSFYEFCNSQHARKGMSVDNITTLILSSTHHLNT